MGRKRTPIEADQAALDALQDQSNRTGDTEHQAERRAALDLYRR
jgi:hypothetical protein